MRWLHAVSSDITTLTDAIDYFQDQLDQAKIECKVKGNIEQLIAQLPAIVEVRFNQLQEIESILEFLNIELKKLKSSYFRKYLENYQRALSARECDKFVDGELEVVDFEKLINTFALIRNQWLGVIKSIDQKSFALNNIVKLRCAGLDDATI